MVGGRTIACTLQPDVREITKSGANAAVGTPSIWQDMVLNQSRLANIFQVSASTASMRSAIEHLDVAGFRRAIARNLLDAPCAAG
jgi:hypothetical protein